MQWSAILLSDRKYPSLSALWAMAFEELGCVLILARATFGQRKHEAVYRESLWGGWEAWQVSGADTLGTEL